MKKTYVFNETIEAILAIKDRDERAKACLEIGLSADNPRHRAVLNTCAKGNGFYATLVSHLLNAWLDPAPRKPVPRRRVVARATFTGLPSLIEGMPSDFDRMMANTYEPQPSSVENAGTAPVDRVDIVDAQAFVDALAFATLNTELADMRGYGSAEDLIPFLDLVESITDKDRELIAEKLRAMPPLEVIDLVPNLFRDFGIEINDETATEQAVMNDVMSDSKNEAGND